MSSHLQGKSNFVLSLLAQARLMGINPKSSKRPKPVKGAFGRGPASKQPADLINPFNLQQPNK